MNLDTDAMVMQKLQNLTSDVLAAHPIPADLNSVIWDLGVVARDIRRSWQMPPRMRHEKLEAIARHVEHLVAQLQLFPVRDEAPATTARAIATINPSSPDSRCPHVGT